MNNRMTEALKPSPRLTSLSHGGGCGCKIAPGVLSEILRSTTAMPLPPELLVGLETAGDAPVCELNEHQALVASGLRHQRFPEPGGGFGIHAAGQQGGTAGAIPPHLQPRQWL